MESIGNTRCAGLMFCAILLGAATGAAKAQGGGMRGSPPTTAPAIQTMPEVLNIDALADQGKALLEQARAGSGSAGITLARYRGHYATLNARTKSGGAEFHANFSDFLIVVAGEGTELTGGTIVGRTEGPNGEARGERLEGATSHPLRKGAIIHIPAGTPHQQIVGPGQSLTVYAIKVQTPESLAAQAQ